MQAKTIAYLNEVFHQNNQRIRNSHLKFKYSFRKIYTVHWSLSLKIALAYFLKIENLYVVKHR